MNGRRKRQAVGLACIATLFLALAVAIFLLELGVSLEWTRGDSKPLRWTEAISNLMFSRGGRVADHDGHHQSSPGGRGNQDLMGVKRAYAVVFSDVHDVLILERALALWNSLKAFTTGSDQVVALLPRYVALELDAPLEEIGYRVLPLDSPAPAWRASGRFVQQTLAALGRSGGRGSGDGWSLLALGALSLVEYDEVVVLDQKMILFSPVESLDTEEGVRRSSEEAHGEKEKDKAVQGEEGPGSATSHGKNSRLLFDGASRRSSGSRRIGIDEESGTDMPRFLPLLPEGDEWTVAFAPGDGSFLRPGSGLQSLPTETRELFSAQHAALMAVRPDMWVYQNLTERLCQGNGVVEDAYPDLFSEEDESKQSAHVRAEMLENRAPTIPLLHLGVASVLSGVESTHLPLEICGGGGDVGVGNGGGSIQPVQADGLGGARNGAPPIAWCPKQGPAEKHGRSLSEVLPPREGRAREPEEFAGGVSTREEGGAGIVFPSHGVVSSAPWSDSPDGRKESESDTEGLESPALSRSSSISEGQQNLSGEGVVTTEWFRRRWRLAEIVSGSSTEGNSRALNGDGYSGGPHRVGEVGDLRRYSARDEAPREVEREGSRPNEASRASGSGTMSPAFGRRWRGRRLDAVVAAGAGGELDVESGNRESAETSRTVGERSKGGDEGGQKELPGGRGSTEEENPQEGMVVGDKGLAIDGEIAPEESTMRESANPEEKIPREEVMTEKIVERVESEKAVSKEIGSAEKAAPVEAIPEEAALEAEAAAMNEEGMPEGDVPGEASHDRMMPEEAVPDEVKPESTGREEAEPRKEAVGEKAGSEETTTVYGKDEESTRQDDTAGREGGEGGVVPRVVLAWIPGDPCSCIDSPGVVGQACRAWLSARAVSIPQAEYGGLPVCSDGMLVFPRQPAPPSSPSVIRDLAIAAATAGAPPALRQGTGEEETRGTGGGKDQLPATLFETPPPLWQERPKEPAVVTERDLKAFQHFWLANEEKKLLMVAIPKVACTQVHALFLRMRGSKKWNTSVLQEIHYHQDMHKYAMSTMKGMTPEKASAMLNDPSWTRAVFLRDPAERLLSCFLDKIVQRKSYSVNIFKEKDILSFEAFVARLSKDAKKRFGKAYATNQLGLSRISNPHWRPQLYFGLDKFLSYFDFVGDFKHVGAHSEELLKRAGLWEEFGASGWGPDGKNAFFQRSTVRGHSTGSHESKSLYLIPPLIASIREAYEPTDYRMLAGLGWWNETVLL